MKITELRVGNLAQTAFGIVEYRGVSPDKPNLLFVKYSNGIDVREHVDDIEPIPLTEEWLVRFGFNKVSHIWEFWENSDWNLKQHKLENKWWLYCCGEEVDSIRIDYVHHLQNLYHALTGEELEMKP